MKELNELINNLNNIQDIQIEIDNRLYENGGELTKELKMMQDAVDRMSEDLIESGVNDVIQAITYLDGQAKTLKEMRTNLTNAIHSNEKFISRIKNFAGIKLELADASSLRAELGSLKVRDEIIVGEIDKEKIEDENMFVLLKYNKDEYLENEFEFPIQALNIKEEPNLTKIKKAGSNGVELKKQKTITIYKKRGKK